MNKIRIAFLGINNEIYEVIKNEINPRNAEIVLFFDNEETKQGICYENIPIAAPSKQLFEEYSIDFVLVAALSAYENVKKQLVELEIPRDKIQVFVAEDIQRFCVGSISDINKDLIRRIYYEPQKILDIVAEYEKIYVSYSLVPEYIEIDGWFNKGSMISHACGGVIKGKEAMYSNSREAFQYTIEKDFKLMECDMMLVDGELILAHDYGKLYEAEQGRFTMLTAEEFLGLLKEHEEISCLVDLKWRDYEEYSFLINKIERFIEKVTNNIFEKDILKKQIVMEVYDEETIRIARENNFDMIFTQYRNPRRRCFMDIALTCCRYGIRAIALNVEECLSQSKFIRILTEKNIKIFVFSTNSVEEYSELRKLNVSGIFTDYLSEYNNTGDNGYYTE